MTQKKEPSLLALIGKFDFEQARIKHVLFKSKIRALLYGANIDKDPILSSTQCSLGKWIYDVAMPSIGHWPEMDELERVHDQMHTIARDLWHQYQQGQEEAARAGLALIDETAVKLLHLLDQLEQKTAS
ncbi:CZB domain-containing protein [Rufibacter sp. LB8]|uniref:CZB domain-containing protein n=1 Tax=Rufibacter sp. LB8 TaxID=2777781 RepID=UPI00178C6754|nr:CZB domain-containing protein [Rufibacter sp. LB8]